MKYAEYLKSVYKVKPYGEQWLRVVSKHYMYINLSTVESIEDFPKEKEVTCTLAMIHAKIEEVKKLKRSITIDQVSVSMAVAANMLAIVTFAKEAVHDHSMCFFNSMQVGVLGDGERARCIIVEGIPGIGKSTFQLAPWGVLGSKGDPS